MPRQCYSIHHVPVSSKFELLCFISFIPYVHCQLRRRYTYLHSYHHVHILSRCFDRTRWCHYYQRLTITSGGVVTLLSFQLQFNLSDDTSHWDGELSYDWWHWTFTVFCLDIFRTPRVQLVTPPLQPNTEKKRITPHSYLYLFLVRCRRYIHKW